MILLRAYGCLCVVGGEVESGMGWGEGGRLGCNDGWANV